MSKLVKPVLGRDYTVLDNGAIQVGRVFPNIMAPWSKERIPDYLSLVDHSLSLGRKKYEKRLAAAEQEFNTLVREKITPQKRTVIIVLQGRDGAGKTGARKVIENALDNDAKIFLAICIGPPSDEEKAHPYLWRFFKYDRMPEFGQVRVFDRSWFERILVEPIMGYCTEEEAHASYGQLRTFEWMLEEQRAIVVKFWMDITKDEQKQRFEDRKEEKPWKLSDSDAVAREHWDDYTVYANEMFYRTGTDFAPWFILASEDKRFSRVVMLETINSVIRASCQKKRIK